MSLRAWLAARLGDEGAEQAALAELLNRVPGDTQAVARLIEQAARAGRTEQVAQLRRRKDRARPGDAKSIARSSMPGSRADDFDKLGQLAETLGRWFEARGWWTLAGRDSTHAAEARAALDRIDRIERALESEIEQSLGRRRAGSVPRALALARPAEGKREQSGGLFRSLSGRQPHTVADALADLIPVDARDRTGAAGPRRLSRSSATTPTPPVSTSSTRTTPRRCAGYPRR